MGTVEEYVFPVDLPPFQQELHIINWFKENFTSNPKKLKKLCLRIRPKLPEFIQASLCDTLYNSNDPVNFIKRAIADMEAWPEAMATLLEAGNHGMIMDGGTLHGITLDTRDNWLKTDDSKWHIDDEYEIIDKAVNRWMVSERRRHFKGRIVLLHEFGFSGISFEVEQRFTQETWDKLQLVWVEEDRKRSTLELEYLLKEKE